jgi:hypothetical protein
MPFTSLTDRTDAAVLIPQEEATEIISSDPGFDDVARQSFPHNGEDRAASTARRAC